MIKRHLTFHAETNKEVHSCSCIILFPDDTSEEEQTKIITLAVQEWALGSCGFDLFSVDQDTGLRADQCWKREGRNG